MYPEGVVPLLVITSMTILNLKILTLSLHLTRVSLKHARGM